MTTYSTAPSPGLVLDRHLPGTPPARASFARLAAVETRKFFDTRLGVVMSAVVLIGAVAALWLAMGLADMGLTQGVVMTGLVLSTLLPALGILAVTSDWRQRTGLSTFALEPRRHRVLLAKAVPPVLATLAACALIVPLGYAVAAAVSDLPDPYALDPAVLAGWVATCVILVLQGVAVGTLVRNAAVSIVICLFGSLYWGLIGLSGQIGATAQQWLDVNTTTIPLLDGAVTASALAPLGVSVLVWVVLPFALGVVRTQRAEI